MKRTQLFNLSLLLFLLLISNACKEKETSCDPSDYSGKWEGSWESSEHSISGTFEVTLIQNAGKLTGTISVSDIDMENAVLTGTVCGNTISFGDIDKTITFSGTFNADSVGSGKYSYSGLSDKGTWTCAKSVNSSAILQPNDTISTNFNAIFLKGATTDGQYFFALSGNNIYKISLDGTIIDTIVAPGNYATGMTFDGQNILVGDDHWGTSTIYRLNGTEPSYIKLHGNGNSDGLAFQGNNL